MPRTVSQLEAGTYHWLLVILGWLFVGMGLLTLHALVFPHDLLKDNLALPNPLSYVLSNRAVHTWGALLEIVVGVTATRQSRLAARAVLFLWLLWAMVAYKVTLVLLNYKGPCACLIGVSNLLPLSAGAQEALSSGVLLTTAILAVIVLLRAWCQEWRTRRGNVLQPT
jgi:hypothetical protein